MTVPLAVGCHLLVSLMPPSPVGFEDDSKGGVGEVDDAMPAVVPRGTKLRLESDDPIVVEQPANLVLEGGLGERSVVEEFTQRSAQEGGTRDATTGGCIKTGQQLLFVRPIVPDLGLDNMSETGRPNESGQVDDGASWTGDGQAADGLDVVGVKGTTLMMADTSH